MPLPTAAPGTIDALACDLARLVLEHEPVTATSLGLYDRDHELPVPSAAALAAQERDLRALRDRVAAAPAPDSDADVDRRGLLAILDAALDRLELERPWERNPLAWARQPLDGILVLLVRTHLDAAHRRTAVAGRLAAMPAYLDAAREILDPGVVPPEWVALAAGTASAGAAFLRDAVVAAHPEAADAAHAGAAALDAYGAWLTDVLAPAAAGSYAAGEERLARLLARVHLLDVSPEQVAARGEGLLEGCTDALVATAGGDWRSALDDVRRSHPALPELVPAYRAELERLQRFCFAEDLVTDPAAEATLEPTPTFFRQFLGYAAYLPPGVFDEVQNGVLWITPPSAPEGLADHSYGAIPAITAHEGYPGHHLQLTSVARLDSVVRTLRGGTSLMVEGWGLYVEELMHEVGYYTPDARLVQLAMTAWRAVRIVVDMGLHTGALTIPEAIDLLIERAGFSRTTARTEVHRYTLTPTQPFTYLYGAEEIRRIRSRWQARTGGSLRQFHDALLGYGHLPPALVAEALTPEGS